MTELSAEDLKIVTLARSAKARVSASDGACARDTTGRTYSSANVSVGNVQLSAVLLAVAQAVASGATGLEAVAATGDFGSDDLDFVRAVGGTSVLLLSITDTGDVIPVSGS
jgi:cytidine deaminase